MTSATPWSWPHPHLGTMLAGVALSRRRVVLTPIGGGVFRNRIEIIWEAILWRSMR